MDMELLMVLYSHYLYISILKTQSYMNYSLVSNTKIFLKEIIFLRIQFMIIFTINSFFGPDLD